MEPGLPSACSCFGPLCIAQVGPSVSWLDALWSFRLLQWRLVTYDSGPRECGDHWFGSDECQTVGCCACGVLRNGAHTARGRRCNVLTSVRLDARVWTVVPIVAPFFLTSVSSAQLRLCFLTYAGTCLCVFFFWAARLAHISALSRVICVCFGLTPVDQLDQVLSRYVRSHSCALMLFSLLCAAMEANAWQQLLKEAMVPDEVAKAYKTWATRLQLHSPLTLSPCLRLSPSMRS